MWCNELDLFLYFLNLCTVIKMLIVVHFSHLMYLEFERQYRNISVGFAIDLSVTCQVQIYTDNNIYGCILEID